MTAPPTSTSNITPNHDALSSGAKEGTGIGVTVLVLAIAAVAYFAFQSRQRASVQSKGEIDATHVKDAGIQELQDTQPQHEFIVKCIHSMNYMLGTYWPSSLMKEREVEMTRNDFETCRPLNSYVLILQ
jgi:hypothetical protein